MGLKFALSNSLATAFVPGPILPPLSGSLLLEGFGTIVTWGRVSLSRLPSTPLFQLGPRTQRGHCPLLEWVQSWHEWESSFLWLPGSFPRRLGMDPDATLVKSGQGWGVQCGEEERELDFPIEKVEGFTP